MKLALFSQTVVSSLLIIIVGYISYVDGYAKGFSKGETKGMNAGYKMCKEGWLQDTCQHGTMYIPPDPRRKRNAEQNYNN